MRARGHPPPPAPPRTRADRTASTGRLTPDLTTPLTSRAGITVSPARCNEPGVLAGGSTVVSGDDGVVTNNGQSSVINDRYGAGLYADRSVSIINNGDGTALVVSPTGNRTVKAEPLPKAPRVGRFPSIDAAKPIESCGTVVTLTDGLLLPPSGTLRRG